MKLLAAVASAMIIVGTNLVSTTANGQVPKTILTIESSAKTATQKGPALAKSTRIPKPKLFRSNPYRKATLNNLDDSEDIFIQDEDLASAYRKRDLEKIRAKPTKDDPDGSITEEIRWRLFLARTAAMVRYHQIHS